MSCSAMACALNAWRSIILKIVRVTAFSVGGVTGHPKWNLSVGCGCGGERHRVVRSGMKFRAEV